MSEEGQRAWNALFGKMRLVQKISKADVQFTLADVLVAMATIDGSGFFEAMPIQPSYNERGFLTPISDPTSNIVFYTPVDKELLASRLEKFLEKKIDVKKEPL